MRAALIFWNENEVFHEKGTRKFSIMEGRLHHSDICMIGLLLLLFALGIMAVRLALKARISSLTWYIDDGWDRKITKKNLNNFVLVRAISNSLVRWLVADAVIDVMHNFANHKLARCIQFTEIKYTFSPFKFFYLECIKSFFCCMFFGLFTIWYEKSLIS